MNTNYPQTSHGSLPSNESLQTLLDQTTTSDDTIQYILARVLNETNSELGMVGIKFTEMCSKIDSMETDLGGIKTNNSSMYTDLKLLAEQVESNEQTAAYGINLTRVDLINTADLINTTLGALRNIMTEKDSVLDTLIESNKTVFESLGEINAEVSTFKLGDNVNFYKNTNVTGAVYTRWGRTSCPRNDAGGIEQIYSGYAISKAGPFTGGGSLMCFPPDPEWNRYDNQTDADYFNGIEYGADILFDHAHQYKDVPCAVCNANTRSTMILIPGRRTCYPGWTTEYAGYIMGDFGHNAMCIDEQPEGIPGGEGIGTSVIRLRFTEISCGTNMLCPPYVNDRQLTCVVCTK